MFGRSSNEYVGSFRLRGSLEEGGVSSMCVWPFGVILIVVGRVGGGGRGVLPFFALGEGRGVVGG